MTMQSMNTNRLVNIDLLTNDYRVVGKVLVRNSGLSGLLTDSTTSFVEIRQAQLAYMNHPTQLVRRFNFLNVIKDRILAALMDRREDLGQSFAYRALTNINRYPIHFALFKYELSGFIEYAGRYSLPTVLAENMKNFVAAYDVAVVSSQIPGFCIQSKAALINFANLDLIAEPVEEKKSEG